MTDLTPEDGCVVLTGAGSGLGRAMALKLAERGFRIIGMGRRIEALTETAQMCNGRMQPVALDVADGPAVAESFVGLTDIALLINNAAIYPRSDFLEGAPGNFMDVVDVNLGGMVHCAHGALRHMAQRGRGRILNVATFADLHVLPGAGAYSVSKGAARIFTRALIADFADRFPEIVIGDWMPGQLATDMGIPDGLPAEISAEWGVRLALRRDPSLNGAVFEMDTEVMPPRGVKGKVKDMVLMRRRTPRRL